MQSRSANTHPFGIIQPIGFPPLPETWTTEAESFPSTGGNQKLFALYHHKKDVVKPKRILIISHGFGEHGGRYLHFPHYLQNTVDGVYVHDHLGHGRSDGQRGDADRFDRYVDDLALVVRRVHSKFPDSELHLFAHSMGGHIGIRLGYLHPDLPLRSFTISAPWLGLVKKPPLPLLGVAKLLSLTYGTLSLSAEVDAETISSDPNVVENYMHDRLNHARMTPRLFTSVEAAIRDTFSRQEEYRYPVRFLIPGNDQLVDQAMTRKFFDQFHCAKKDAVDFVESKHEGMNDLQKEKFLGTLSEWISMNSQV